MERLSSKELIFVSGVEGSGTSILLKLLSVPDFAVALGGNYVSPSTPDYDTKAQSRHLDWLTRVLWLYPDPSQGNHKQEILDQIAAVPIADKFTHVIYKRSYPFKNMNYFPNLNDLTEITNNVRVIVVHRNLAENAVSILRRGFVFSIEEAAQRINMAYRILSKQLECLNGMHIHEVDYAALIANPVDTIGRIEAFLEFPKESLTQCSFFIKRPTRQSHDLLKKNEKYLSTALKQK